MVKRRGEERAKEGRIGALQLSEELPVRFASELNMRLAREPTETPGALAEQFVQPWVGPATPKTQPGAAPEGPATGTVVYNSLIQQA